MAIGSIISVFKLFEKYPVRRNLIAKEWNRHCKQVRKIVTSFAMIAYNVAFQLKIDGQIVLSKPVCSDIAVTLE